MGSRSSCLARRSEAHEFIWSIKSFSNLCKCAHPNFRQFAANSDAIWRLDWLNSTCTDSLVLEIHFWLSARGVWAPMDLNFLIQRVKFVMHGFSILCGSGPLAR